MDSKKADRPALNGGFWVHIAVTLVILLSFLMAAGCPSETEEITASPGEQFSLAIGQSASISGEELKVRFLEVVTDSRCPAGATCIWQGEVTCLVEITYFESLHRKTLTQPGLSSTATASFTSYEITFNVEPYPEVGREIKKSDYRLQMRIDKNPALSGGILVTFDVVGERYSIFITNKTTIDQVLAVEQGNSTARIPSGRLISGSVFYNEPWSWHIDPEDIHMAEVTIELCDGTPSQVEDDLDYWLQSVQRFCPWNAEIVKIEDFR